AQRRKAGLTGAAFLKVGVGARAAAMGTAVTAMPNDINQIFYNPAGIGLKEEKLQFAFNYNKWIADLNHNSAAVSYNFEGIGTFGLGFIQFGVTGITADRDQPADPFLIPNQIDMATGATYDYSDVAVMLSYSRYVIDRLALGVTVKGIFQSIDDQSVSSFAFDFGSVYHVGVLDWTIAARFNNLGRDMEYYDISFGLPLEFSVGTALAPWGDEDGNRFLVALDFVKPQDGPQYYFTGGEFTLMRLVSLRAGYKFNYSGTSETTGSFSDDVNTTIEGFSGGLGVAVPMGDWSFRLDYAYTSMDLLDAAHRVSIAVGMK
ncbi:MAG: PorV/PorQ family protein, partial [Bacteroidota bacterium]